MSISRRPSAFFNGKTIVNNSVKQAAVGNYDRKPPCTPTEGPLAGQVADRITVVHNRPFSSAGCWAPVFPSCGDGWTVSWPLTRARLQGLRSVAAQEGRAGQWLSQSGKCATLRNMWVSGLWNGIQYNTPHIQYTAYTQTTMYYNYRPENLLHK